MKTKLFFASSALAAAVIWAVPATGAAHFTMQPEARPTARPAVSSGPARLSPVRLRVDRERGLLLRVWLNGSGPYVFAVDTGAGMNVISQRLVTEGRLPTKSVPATLVGGLSSQQVTANREAILTRVALGDAGNTLPKSQTALVVSNLPPDIDGIIDPTEAYAPNGYSIDLPKLTMEPLASALVSNETPARADEGAVVSWIRKSGDTRPFVRLGDGRLALVDTGSRFGLAVSDRDAIIISSDGQRVPIDTRQDVAGGIIRSRRVAPTTISIGALVLRRIPTDIIFGVHKDAPLILGRDALSPFKISFDPQRRLIEFVTSSYES
jgi:Aspartyl protease